ncbi:hypothetical protein V3H18_02555 [Methylocystis sp. 9N]|uniref:Uncharacterized protein n=1 Tax=Methylocystis borbori TaxID=3118750 RepID=A0ABU7XFT1_9HYPH
MRIVQQACLLGVTPPPVVSFCPSRCGGGALLRVSPPGCSTGAAGLRPAISRHSSTPQAVFSIGAGGGSVRSGATFPSSRTTT